MLTVITNWPSTVRRFILRVNSCVFIHNPQNIFLQGRTIVCKKNYFVIFKIMYSFIWMIFWWKMLILIQKVIACRTQVYGKGGCYPCEPSLISINIIQMIYSASSNNIIVSYSCYLTDLRLHVIFLPHLMCIIMQHISIINTLFF